MFHLGSGRRRCQNAGARPLRHVVEMLVRIIRADCSHSPARCNCLGICVKNRPLNVPGMVRLDELRGSFLPIGKSRRDTAPGRLPALLFHNPMACD